MSQRTIRCRLGQTKAQEEALEQTAKAFALGAIIALGYAIRAKTTNRIKIQHLCYREIREKTGLSANLAVRAIARAGSSLASARSRGGLVKTFQPTSIDYDQRIFEWRERDEQVSISTVLGRLRIPVILGEFQRKTLTGKKPTFAMVIKKGSRWYIHIVIDEEDPIPAIPITTLGVDRGLYNAAVASTGKFYGGRKALHERRKILAHRARLQRKGTRGARRLLKRLSGKESRRSRHVNHCISKGLIDEATTLGAAIILENLRGIRQHCGVKGKTSLIMRHRINSWPFFQLEQFIKYKAIRAGIPVLSIPAYGTSIECPSCGAIDKASRNGAHYLCTSCGYHSPADLSAARVIAKRGARLLGLARAVVNQPICSSVRHPVIPSGQSCRL